MLSTQVPGTKDKPYACEAPRTEGMFSSAIRIYGLVSPNILICFDPVIASEKFTSMDGLVSKDSAKLQQAAFNNSLLDMVCVLRLSLLFLLVDRLLVRITISSKSPIGSSLINTKSEFESVRSEERRV